MVCLKFGHKKITGMEGRKDENYHLLIILYLVFEKNHHFYLRIGIISIVTHVFNLYITQLAGMFNFCTAWCTCSRMFNGQVLLHR